MLWLWKSSGLEGCFEGEERRVVWYQDILAGDARKAKGAEL